MALDVPLLATPLIRSLRSIFIFFSVGEEGTRGEEIVWKSVHSKKKYMCMQKVAWGVQLFKTIHNNGSKCFPYWPNL